MGRKRQKLRSSSEFKNSKMKSSKSHNSATNKETDLEASNSTIRTENVGLTNISNTSQKNPNSDVEMEYNSTTENGQLPVVYRSGKHFYRYGFVKLETMSREDSTEIIIDLLLRKAAFSELLDSDLKPDWIPLIIMILSKVCLSLYEEVKTIIINLVMKDSFLRSLRKFVMIRKSENRQNNICAYFWTDVNAFLTNLMVVCETSIETVPSKVKELLPVLLKAVENFIATFEKDHDQLNDKMKLKLKYLLEKLNFEESNLGPKNEWIKRTKNFNPPDDFRKVSVYPSREDILTSNDTFLKKLIIDGKYDSVDHYLDVQFRLLKEDFIAPLRQSIAEYFTQYAGSTHIYKNLSNIRIHTGVTFLLPHILNSNQVGVILKFPAKNTLQGTFTAHSERFKYGSLVCFTKDNFSSVLFGKTIDKDLKHKFITVGFEPGDNNYEYGIPYTMIECKIYYEPYYHVLKALQSISETGFPMENYVIHAIPKIKRPNYLNISSCKYMIDDKTVDVLDDTWPIPDSCPLNNTQFSAFKAALTQKFVVIQGPPGTGKTYLGLKIVKTLLHNKNIQIWNNKTPILIVCYTNHALDQFLEGLTSTTDRIVRVGSQSKNEELTKYNLSSLRTDFINQHQNISDIFHSCKRRVQDLSSKIKTYEMEIKEMKSFKSILRFKNFSAIDKNYGTSWFANASDAHILAWLLGEESTKSLKLYSNIPDNLSDDSDTEKPFYYSDEDEELGFYQMDKVILLSKSDLHHQISKFRNLLKKIDSDLTQEENSLKKWEIETDLTELSRILKYLKIKLKYGKSIPPPKKPNTNNYHSPERMHPNDRWNLYFYWLYLYQDFVTKQLVELQRSHSTEYKKYLEIRNIQDANLMKNMLVVGMTTTGAARLQSLLHTLKCRIVIVEEAAEVLESHVTVSISHHCEHLILLGDHQQLRPSTSDYRIETDFNLGISMFERMVRNKIQCHVLDVQHRMRPEIAQLIVPHIYPKLENHPSVEAYPPVLGIKTSLYFIHHVNNEVTSEDESKSNSHEAQFLLSLARYLIQNGYEPEDITILSAYSAQLFLLKTESRKFGLILRDVRITVLDNFQGEESKIILLSLVRNNNEGKIGFLKIENRVCVALSRAKHGFYIMGNIDLLSNNSKLWYNIKQTLVRQNCLGNYLTVCCQVHPDNMTRIEKASDFDKLPNGACQNKCETLMICGHRCRSHCHLKDRLHRAVKCKESCLKVLCKKNHICQKMCYEICGKCTAKVTRILGCRHKHVLPCHVDPKEFKCETQVTAILPCGHKISNKPCYQDLSNFQCQLACGASVNPCGHICILSCHINDDLEHKKYKCLIPCKKIAIDCRTKTHLCPKLCYEKCSPCKVVVKRKLKNCNHLHSAMCSSTSDEIKCVEPCDKFLSCGHQCKRKCHETCGDCQEMIPKILSACGHEVMTTCGTAPDLKNCIGQCSKSLKCGHSCKKKCNELCSAKCEELVDNHDSYCGHKFQVMCYLARVNLPNYRNKLLQYCKEPCSKILECSHKCSGTCGSCFQGRIHVICSETCGIPLVCGHKCTIPCNEICQPCQLKCSIRCVHITCKKKCGENCTNCKEPCSRRCKHLQCKAICASRCTVAPCQKPCDKILPCSHLCTGYCGDPCPPICKICDKEKLPEIIFGYAEDIDTTFVLLDECQHIIESKAMEIFCKQGGNENGVQISYQRCPKCGMLLTSTERYRDYIKETINDMVNIHKKKYGSFYERKASRNELQQMLRSVEELQHTLIVPVPTFTAFVNECRSLFASVNNDQQLFNMFMGKNLEAKLSIVRYIGIMLKGKNCGYRQRRKTVNSTICWEVEDYLQFLFKPLLSNILQITNQEILDFEREVWRLQRITQVIYISTKFQNYDLKEIRELVYKPVLYTQNYDKTLKIKLLELYKKLKIPALKDNQHCQIVKTMGLKRGNWFKCLNGHYYFIPYRNNPKSVNKCRKCKEQTEY